MGLYVRGAKLLVRGAKLSKYLPKISKFVQKITGLIKNNKYLKQAGNFIKNIPNMIKNNKIVQKVANTIKNNKLIKKAASLIVNNKYVKKATSIVKNGWNSIKKLPNKIMNSLSSTKNNLMKHYNNLKNKAINYITDKSNKFSYKLNRVVSKFKNPISKFNKFSSTASSFISWISRPDKKIVSKVFNYGYKKFVKHNRSILKSKNVSQNVKNSVYKKSLVAKAINTYISNPIRSFKNIIFPDTKRIKNNYNNVTREIKKHNPIHHLYKPVTRNNHRSFVPRRRYIPPRPRIQFHPRRIVNRVVRPIKNTFSYVRSGFNRVGDSIRFVTDKVIENVIMM